MEWTLESGNEDNDIFIKELTGGSGRNIVPSKAQCALNVKNACVTDSIRAILENKNFEYAERNGGFDITCRGQSTHAMNPEKGKNAISILMGLLKEITQDKSCNLKNFVNSYAETIGMGYNGREIGIYCEDEATGPLTFNVGTIRMEQGEKAIAECNIRIPATKKYDEVVPDFIKKLEQRQIAYKEVSFLDAIRLDVESPTVQALYQVFQEVTGDYQSKPLAIGGATYARCLNNAISFGPIFPGDEDRTHEADEYLKIQDMKTIMALYIEGMLALLK